MGKIKETIFFSLVFSKLFCNVNAVTGGDIVTSAEKYPFMVTIQPKSHRQHLCAGSIISERFILTAAHCMKRKNRNKQYVAVVGTTSVDSGGQPYEIENWTIHEKYYDPDVWDYDFGLVKIKNNFEFTNFVKPIELPVEDTIEPGDEVVMIGFGYPMDKPTKDLHEFTVKTKLCQKETSNSSTCICTEASSTFGFNNGDSGGPLIYKSGNGINVLVGVISCLPDNSTGESGKVYAFLIWIEEQKKKLLMY